MKFISWNVNGFRAALRHDFIGTFDKLDADIFGIQNIRLSQDEVHLQFPGYYEYWNYSDEKGYDGVAIFTKKKPLAVTLGIGIPPYDRQGRTITLEYSNFYYINTYVPFSGEDLSRLGFRMGWDDAFRAYVADLMKNKPVIIGGDMSVANEPIDLAEPDENRHHAGFTEQERSDFKKLLKLGLVDTFRYMHPEKASKYTYWSYRYNARSKNKGWRLDYFLVSDSLKSSIKKAKILSTIPGSDHCPISLKLNMK